MTESTETVVESHGNEESLKKLKKKKKAPSESTNGSLDTVTNPSDESISLSPDQKKWDSEWQFIPDYKKGNDGTSEIVLVISPRDLLIAPFDARAADGIIPEDFKRSITENGVFNPVLVSLVRHRTTGEERYALLAGRRRVRAACEINNEKTRYILATVCPVKDWAQALKVAFHENQFQLPMNTWDRVQWCKQMQDKGCTQVQIAEASSLSNPAITKYMQVLDLDPRIQRFVKLGKLDTSKTRELARLKGPDGELLHDLQFDIADRAVEKGWRAEDIRDQVERAKAKIERKTSEEKAKARTRKKDSEEVEETEEKDEEDYKFDRAAIAQPKKVLAHLILEYHFRKLQRMRANDAATDKVKFQEGIIEGMKLQLGLKEPPKSLLDEAE